MLRFLAIWLSLVLEGSLVSALGKWTNLCKIGEDICPTIMMGVGCKDKDMCAIVGGFSNTKMSVYYTEDEFTTFTLADMERDSMMLLDIAIDTDGKGATAGIGVLGMGILRTDDVKTWENSADFDLLTGQDMESMGNGEFGFVGNTNGAKSQGVLFSTDGAKHWQAGNWPANVSNSTQARYGSFPSEKVWYVTGGNWDSSTQTQPDNDCLRLSETLCIPASKEAIRAHNDRPTYDGYYGILTKTSDGGQTWEVQFETNDFYFNHIHCIDVDTCMAVGENHAGSTLGGYIMSTTNGGKNWTQVFKSTVPGAGLMPVHMVSKLEAWAAGGDNKGGTFYHTSDGGKTWELDGPEFRLVGEVMDLHFVDDTLGFAVAILDLQICTVFRYTN